MSESQRPRSKRSTNSNDASERGEHELDTSGPSNIPVPLTSVVGRERDVSLLSSLLQSGQTRLLTLTGPGGVGKTRLALQVAVASRGSFLDGAFFIALAPINNPDLILSTIAQTLGVPEAPGQPLLSSLCSALRDRHTLLILDNFEQVVSAGPHVLDLLQCAPRLHALITSRTVLHVYGEQEYPVSPLTLPDASPQLSIKQIAQTESVRLFIDRVRAVKPAFTVTNENAPVVAEICRRLDGLPLALELAAARSKLLSPQALLHGLDRSLSLLTHGATSLPYRHQTLRNAISWSYDLLTEDEKGLFQTLSVFVGGCTLDAAEAVWTFSGREFAGSWAAVNPSGGPYPGSSTDNGRQNNSSVLDALAALVDKSLLRHDEQEDGEPRFSMLETIRDFAVERLEEADSVNNSKATHIKRLHAEYYLALAEAAEPHLTGPEQLAWGNRIETEHDNLRAALSTTLMNAELRSSEPPAVVGTRHAGSEKTQSDIPHAAFSILYSAWVGLRLAGTIWQFWAMRGYLT